MRAAVAASPQDRGGKLVSGEFRNFAKLFRQRNICTNFSPLAPRLHLAAFVGELCRRLCCFRVHALQPNLAVVLTYMCPFEKAQSDANLMAALVRNAHFVLQLHKDNNIVHTPAAAASTGS